MGDQDREVSESEQKETQDLEAIPSFSRIAAGEDNISSKSALAMAGQQDRAEDNTIKKDRLEARRSRWSSSWASLRYVSSLSRDDDIKMRDSDRITSVCLLIGSILIIISLVFQPLRAHRLSLLIACDALVFFMLLFYVVNRFGILHTLMPRQALLTWQLIVGAGFVGIYMTINLAVLIAFIVAKSG